MHHLNASGRIGPLPRTLPRSVRLLPLMLAALLLLSGCSGGGGSDQPTATSATLEQPSGVQASGSQPSGGQAAEAAPRVVGDLVNRIGGGWQGVTSFRATTRQGTGDIASIPLPQPPVSGAIPPESAGSGPQAVVDEVILPDRRHYLENSGGAVSEYIAAGGSVFARGRFTQVSVRPDLDATTWVNLDPAFISTDSPIGQFLSQFAGSGSAAFRAPLADLQPDTRTLTLTDRGPVDVGGHACHAWQWKETGAAGDLMTRVVSIDVQNLPCSLEFDSGDYHSRTVWDGFNAIPNITAPTGWVTVGSTLGIETGAGTPSATEGTPAPPGLPATPFGAGLPATAGAPATPITAPGTAASPPTAVTPLTGP